MKKEYPIALGGIILLAAISVAGCKTTVTMSPPGSLHNLEVTTLSQEIGANLMPMVPPDPVFCRIVLVLRNISRTETISGVSIPQAVVLKGSSGEPLGDVFFASAWDGRLDPGERDTVRLVKLESSLQSVPAACNDYVALNLVVSRGAHETSTINLDRALFRCVY